MRLSAPAMSDAKNNFVVDTVGVTVEMTSFGNESLTGLKPSLIVNVLLLP
jgi:hypothetical protein